MILLETRECPPSADDILFKIKKKNQSDDADIGFARSEDAPRDNRLQVCICSKQRAGAISSVNRAEVMRGDNDQDKCLLLYETEIIARSESLYFDRVTPMTG